MKASIEVGTNGRTEDLAFWQAIAGNNHRPKLLDLAYEMAERGVHETDPTEGRGQIWRLRLHTLQSLRGDTKTRNPIGGLLRMEISMQFVMVKSRSARETAMFISSWRYAK